MDKSIDQIADDWIEFQRYDINEVPDEVFARGWGLNDLAYDDPELAWSVIKCVVGRYENSDLVSDDKNEAKHILGMAAAGPLDNLLDQHGPGFIERIEAEARVDARFKWTLGGVWHSGMTDDVRARVKDAAGSNPYWT